MIVLFGSSAGRVSARNVLLASLVWVSSSQGLRSQTWNGSFGQRWSDPLSWVENLPANDGTAEVIFSRSGRSSYDLPRLDLDWNVRTIHWNLHTFDQGGVGIAGTTAVLTLQEGLTNASLGRVEIYPDTVLPGLQTWRDTNTDTTGRLSPKGTFVYGDISGPGGISKTGSGILQLAGTNSFTGQTEVLEGILELAGPASGGNASTPLVLNGGTLRLIDLPFPASFSKNLFVGTAGGTLQSPHQFTHQGTISGPGMLRFQRITWSTDLYQSRVSLSGVNTHAGGTMIDAVTVKVSGAEQTLGSGDVTIQARGVLALEASTNLAAGRRVAMQPLSVLVLDPDVIPPTSIISSDPVKTTGGIIAIKSASALTPIDMSQIGDGTLYLGAAGASTYSAPSLGVGAGNVYRLGGGFEEDIGRFPILTIASRNVLTGANSVQIGAPHAFGDFADARFGGVVAIDSPQDYTGGTLLTDGTLQIGADGALGQGPLTLDFRSFGVVRMAASGAARVVTNSISIIPEATGVSSMRLVTPFPMRFEGNVNLGGAPVSFQGGNTLVTFAGTMSNGTPTLAGGLWAFEGANSVTSLTLAGANLKVGSDSALGTAGGALLLHNGTLQATSSFVMNRDVRTAGATGAINVPVGLRVSLNGSLTDTSTFGNGSLIKQGAGTLSLGGATNRVDTLLVQGGTLLMENITLTLRASIVSRNATLAGTGSIRFVEIQAGGKLAPGIDASPGTLTITDGLAMQNQAILDFDLGIASSDKILFSRENRGSGVPLASDRVIVNVADAGGLAEGQSYVLMDWNLGVPSTFTANNFTLGSGSFPGTFSIRDKQLLFHAIPEPSSVVFTSLGAVLFGARRRRTA